MQKKLKWQRMSKVEDPHPIVLEGLLDPKVLKLCELEGLLQEMVLKMEQFCMMIVKISD